MQNTKTDVLLYCQQTPTINVQQPQLVRIKYAVMLIKFITGKLALQLTVCFSFCLIFGTLFFFFIVFLQEECRLKLQFQKQSLIN